MRKNAFVTIFFAATLYGLLAASNDAYLYRDFLTGFADVSSFNDANSGFIVIDNNENQAMAFETLPFNRAGRTFSYTIRMKDGDEQKNSRWLASRSAPTARFGVVWNFIDENNYMAVSIARRADCQYDDIMQRQSLIVELLSIENGAKRLIERKEVDGALAFSPRQYNSYRIAYSKQRLTVSAGHKELAPLFTVDSPLPPDSCRIGYFVEPDGFLKVKRIQFESSPIKELMFTTAYTRQSLDSVFAKSADPLEGYWAYLDRSTDDKMFELGGKYKIAIVRTDDGRYDILYIDGARLYPDLWQPLMKKGELKSTPFIGHYDLAWHDALKNTVNDETYAVLEHYFLSFHFPLQKSQVRFYKLTTLPEDNP